MPRPTNSIKWTQDSVLATGRAIVWCAALGAIITMLALAGAVVTGQYDKYAHPPKTQGFIGHTDDDPR